MPVSFWHPLSMYRRMLTAVLSVMAHEQEPDISVYQSQHFEAQIHEEITEGAKRFIAQVTDGNETVLFTYTPPGEVSAKILASSPPPEIGTSNLQRSSEQRTPSETEKPVRL